MSKAYTTFKQKILLLFFSILLSIVCIEGLLQLGGIILARQQESRNQKNLSSSEIIIMCIGESTTMDGGIDSYPRQLERILNSEDVKKYKVINRGIPGTNSATILSKIEEWIDEYKPQIVVSMIGINDNYTTPIFDDVSGSKGKSFFRSLNIPILYNWIVDSYSQVIKEFKDTNVISVETIDDLKKEIRRDSKNLVLYETLAQLYLDAHNKTEAENVYKLAIKKNSKKSLGYELLSKFYERRGDKKIALEVLERARVRNKTKGWAYSLLAQYFRREGLLKEAENILEIGLLEANAKEEIYFQKMITYLEIRNYEKAVAIFEHFVKEQKPGAGIYTQAGIGYLYLGEAKKSKEMFLEAFELDHNKGIFVIDWLIKNDEYPLAESILLEYLNRYPENMRVYRSLATLYKRWGKMELAKSYFDKVVILSKDFYSYPTKVNYRSLIRLLKEKKISVVSVQYPIRSVEPLKKMLEEFDGIIYVSNEEPFKSILKEKGFDYLFTDSFAGDFGHATVEGTRLLATNVANVILANINNINNSR